jgi:ElaB/YqjD/DUF883 family membrane-anchored ribosome-binding protein
MLKENTKNIKAAVKENTQAVTEELHDSAKKISRLATKGAHELHDAADKAGAVLNDAYQIATENLTHAADSVKTKIRTKPVQATLIALGAGIILGALLNRLSGK